MNYFLNKTKPTLTVGIATCYGDKSILDVVKSVRNSKGIKDFRFIIVADSKPFSSDVKRELKKYKVELVENKTKGSQISKHKQIIKMANSDLLVLTQDDVIIDPNALKEVVNEFKADEDLTMVSVLNKPIGHANIFETVLNVGTNLANLSAKYWNQGDNYLSVIGRFIAFRTNFLKKLRLADNVTISDTYYYLTNKRNGGKYKYLPNIYIGFRNPQNMEEHLRKSSRFQYSNKEMSRYFKNLDEEYKMPKKAVLRAILEQTIQNPFKTALYFGVFFYTRILRLKPGSVLNPLWTVDLSTKKIK